MGAVGRGGAGAGAALSFSRGRRAAGGERRRGRGICLTARAANRRFLHLPDCAGRKLPFSAPA